jgi:hypothetical protein
MNSRADNDSRYDESLCLIDHQDNEEICNRCVIIIPSLTARFSVSTSSLSSLSTRSGNDTDSDTGFRGGRDDTSIDCSTDL